jgi:hypothetical protein
MRRKIQIMFAIIVLFMSIARAFPQESPNDVLVRALAKYKDAEDLYDKGEYKSAADLLDSYISEFEAHPDSFTDKLKAKIYLLRGTITYAFREEGYRQEIEQYFLKAIERDLDLEPGDPAKVPAYVINLFTKLKVDYIHSFSREIKKSEIGLFAAFVMEPAGSQSSSYLQPGISYTFCFDNNFDIGLDIRFPLKLPVWDSIRGQLGFTWFPYYRVENLCMGISTYYAFGLDQLRYYTHAISFCGRGEIVLRSGFGIAASVEVFRLDLLFGDTSSNPPQESRYVDLVQNVLRLEFANINFYLIYNF